MKLSTVVITGATGAIGSALTEAFWNCGYQVAAVYHQNREAARQLEERFGERLITLQCDVSDSASVEAAFAEVRRQFGGVDVLVNNAGNAQFSLLTDVTDAEWRSIMGVHLDGSFYCCRAALPDMVRQKSGCIINISSIWGITGGSCEAAYSAAKAGIIGLTKALAKEVGPSNITVNCIAPGVIGSPMNDRLSAEEMAALTEEIPLGRIGSGGDVASLAVYLAQQGGFITGQVISPNGGMVI